MSESRHDRAFARARALAAAILLAGGATSAAAQNSAAVTPADPTYADLADLAQSAAVVAVVEVRDQAEVEPERAPGLAPGRARLYV